MLELLYTSNKTLTKTNSYNIFSLFYYIAAWDALMLWDYPYQEKVYRDGTQVKISSGMNVAYNGGRVGGRIWGARDFKARLCETDDLTCLTLENQPLNPDWDIAAVNKLTAGNYIDDDLDLYIHAGNGILEFYRLSDGTLLRELHLSSGYVSHRMVYAGPGKLMFFDDFNSRVYLVNYIETVELWKATLRPFLFAAYDCNHDLILTLESDSKVRVYLTTPIPSVLAAPAFYPVYPHPHKLAGYQLRTRLTGSGGEPCVGYWISWDLLGAPPKGYLVKPKTKTDAQGYATNFWFTGEVLGAETVWVEIAV